MRCVPNAHMRGRRWRALHFRSANTDRPAARALLVAGQAVILHNIGHTVFYH